MFVTVCVCVCVCHCLLSQRKWPYSFEGSERSLCHCKVFHLYAPDDAACPQPHHTPYECLGNKSIKINNPFV